MKYLKDINENFKLVDLGNHNWFGKQPDNDYIDRVKSHCHYIMEQETGTSEKDFNRLDRIYEIYKKTVADRSQEFDAIVHNCKSRNMRPEYCAETVYHAVLQGRVNSLMERDWEMGGLKTK